MNLVVDIGNTLVKTGVFGEKGLIAHQSSDRENFISSLEKTKLDFPEIGTAIISHVGKMEGDWGKHLQREFAVTGFSASTPIPFKNSYKTPGTLGLDRIALVAAAFEKYPGKDVLVIDAGTSITYDFLDKKGNYHGGAISPGIQMRLKALHVFTDRLPLVPFMENPDFLGKSTLESIQSGVINGTSFEINGFINAYRENHPGLITILTGGDAQTLSKSIKNTIFAPSYFLLEGLNSILEFNKPK